MFQFLKTIIASFIGTLLAISLYVATLHAPSTYQISHPTSSNFTADSYEYGSTDSFVAPPCLKLIDATEALGDTVWQLSTVAPFGDLPTIYVFKLPSEDAEPTINAKMHCVNVETDFKVPLKVRLREGRLVAAD